MKPLVSVVIPSYNQESTIKSCLESVLAQKTGIPYEVIVVDSSANNAAKIAERFVPNITLARRKNRTSWGSARNAGLKIAKGEIVAFTDTDCIVGDNWVEDIWKAHKGYDVVGGPIENGNPGNLFGWMPFLMEFGEFAVKRSKIVSNLPGCNVSYKRRLFRRYGQFPANQWSGFGDDFLFNVRIKEKMLYSDKIIVSHINKTKIRQILHHASEQGKADARAIKLSPRLPGQLLVKWKFLIPLLFFYRFVAIGWRAVRSGNFMIFLLVSPLVALNVFSWNIGFLKGALK
jgi:glycosyltransferase involved in cell wall biosynthesis